MARAIRKGAVRQRADGRWETDMNPAASALSYRRVLAGRGHVDAWRALVLRRAVWPRYSHHPTGGEASFRQIRSGERRYSAVCCAAVLRARHRRGEGSVGAGEPAAGAQR